MTHNEAKRLFATARDKNAGKPLGRNARLMKRGDDYAVRLHQTDVVTIHADGTYTLDSGDWRTVTTKRWINEHTPARLYQRKGAWYFGLAVEYHDGVRIDANGREIVTRTQRTLAFAA